MFFNHFGVIFYCPYTFVIRQLCVLCICSTFKQECPARLTVSARKDGMTQWLAVTKNECQHNHDLSAAAYHLYPSVRRLTPAQQEEQQELVSIQLSVYERLVHSYDGSNTCVKVLESVAAFQSFVYLMLVATVQSFIFLNSYRKIEQTTLLSNRTLAEQINPTMSVMAAHMKMEKNSSYSHLHCFQIISFCVNIINLQNLFPVRKDLENAESTSNYLFLSINHFATFYNVR